MIEPSALTLARYSVALGVRGLRRGPLSAALWRIWMPLDVDRVRELPWVGSRILRARPHQVLDIASPKLLACWLSDQGLEVVATDVWAQEVADWRRLTGDVLQFETADATDLQYDDASFDAAYSASVIEHIPGDGDTAAMAELARVLKPGGTLALTFPFAREHYDEHVEHDLYGERYTGTPIFFQRHYSSESVESRLLSGGAFTVVERGIWRKAAVQEAQGRLRRIVPARFGIGRFLGPLLMVLGARALTDARVEDPGPDNVMRLLLRAHLMRVALNLVYLVPGETGGMEVYARELIPRLAERVDVVALVNREAAAEGGPWADVAMRVVPVHARSRPQWVLGEQVHVPRLAAGCDLIHSLASTSPLASRARRITTIHDLNYKLVPEAHFGLRALGMQALVPAAARRSHRILVDAESTKRDLAEHLRTPGAKVDVAPLGVTLTPVAPAPYVRERHDLGDGPLVLSVSAKRPHKNLMRLLDAVALLESKPVLVLPGYPTPHEAELKARAAYLGVRAVFPAWVSAEDVEGLYAEAAAFVFPSLAEGFGLPVLEAMARGVPVACSDRSSLPEVAGDAALLFDPLDPRAIADAITRLFDPAVADRLRVAGRERVREFTWERCAELTVAAYERTL